MAQMDPRELTFGKLVLHYQLASREQVQAALRTLASEGGMRGLAEILVDSGVLREDQATKLRGVQRQMEARDAGAADGGQDGPGALGRAPASQAEDLDATRPSPTAAGTTSESPPPAPTAPTSPPASTPADPDAGLPLPERMDDLLRRAADRGASDLHIHSGAPLRLRLGGVLRTVGDSPVAPEKAEALLDQILTDDQRRRLDDSGQVDLAYTLEGVGRFRGNVYRQQHGLDGVFRAIPPRPPSLDELGLPDTLARFTDYHQGMVLVTGPAGCGKSSTLAALVHLINQDRREHIITVEDPIEYLHPSRACLVNQRQVKVHTESFARALRAALREDPDIIVIGELRDLETISLALTAAETGHLVLATLHTANAIRTINRLVGAFPPEQQSQIRTMVSESLRAIVSQRLVNRIDGEGRVPALEILVANKAVGNLIRESKTFQIRSVLQTGGAQGMCQLDNSLDQLVRSGTIAREEAALHAEDPSRFGGRSTPAAGTD